MLPKDHLDPDAPAGSDAKGTPEFRRSKLKQKGTTAAKAAMAIWRARGESQTRYEAQWRVNEYRRSGLRNVRLRKGNSGWDAWVPPHIEESPDSLQTMNLAASQCRKFLGIMLTDPPAPDCQATRGTEDDKESAEFATRALIHVQNDQHLNDQRLIRRAFDKASTYGSGFIWYRYDPLAGEHAPVKIYAGVGHDGRVAETEDDALDDPETGLPWPDYAERYVSEDGSLSNDLNSAKTEPVGMIRGRVLTGRNVRMMPHDAKHVSEAYGVQIGYFETLGSLARQYDKLQDLEDEEIEDLTNYRPTRWEWLVSDEERNTIQRTVEDPYERYVFVLVTYIEADSDEFPEGLCQITVGGKTEVVNEPWVEDVDQDDGTTERVSLPLPVTQYGQFREGSDNPYSHGLMEILGPGNETRSKIIADWLTFLTKANNRKTFLPIHSNIRPEQLRLPGHQYLRILPGSEPKYEDVGTFSSDAYRYLDFVTNETQNASGLGEVAQGLESPQVQSGRHAQAIVSQAHATLSDIRQNIIDGYLHGCRIQLALIRAYFTRSRRMSFVGEDGAFKEREWTGNQISGSVQVFLKNGTLTMLTPVAKAQLAEHMYMLGTIDQQSFQEISFNQMGPMVGLQDDPFRNRIKRQVAAFLHGPPPQWQPQFTEQPMAGPDGQPMVDPQTGQPAMQQVQEMDPVLAGIFRPYPVDDLPYVAQTRIREIAKAMSTSEFATLPGEWQFGLLSEFARAQQAAAAAAGGQQPGQPPQAGRSPAQQQATEGPAAMPDTPLPTELANDGGGL